jgi:hypothetical protein
MVSGIVAHSSVVFIRAVTHHTLSRAGWFLLSMAVYTYGYIFLLFPGI